MVAAGSLARHYLHVKDIQEAIRWFRRAAELGDADAQGQLGRFYLEGQGVPRDEREAFHWYSTAAKNYNPYAYVVLARLYLHGTGTERDLVTALANADIALKVLNNSETYELERAKALKSAIAAQLSSDQIQQARQRARELRPDVMQR